jgi:hypothetical protein
LQSSGTFFFLCGSVYAVPVTIMATMKLMLQGILFLLAFSVCNAATLVGADSYFSGLSSSGDKRAYSKWVQDHDGVYEHHTFLSVPGGLDPDAGAAVFWKVHAAGVTSPVWWIQFAVAVRATGWVGFGVSESGGMTGADITLFRAADPLTLKDSFVTNVRFPQTDKCQSWDLVDSTMEDGWMIVEMVRPLDTEDNQDRKIMDDSQTSNAPTNLIAAWGDGFSVAYHGMKRAINSVRLFSAELTSFPPLQNEQDLESGYGTSPAVCSRAGNNPLFIDNPSQSPSKAPTDVPTESSTSSPTLVASGSPTTKQCNEKAEACDVNGDCCSGSCKLKICVRLPPLVTKDDFKLSRTRAIPGLGRRNIRGLKH